MVVHLQADARTPGNLEPSAAKLMQGAYNANAACRQGITLGMVWEGFVGGGARVAPSSEHARA